MGLGTDGSLSLTLSSGLQMVHVKKYERLTRVHGLLPSFSLGLGTYMRAVLSL